MRCDCRLWGCNCRLRGCDCRKWISGLYSLICCKHFENALHSRKKIWIRGVVYEIAGAITNLLKTITGPLKKMEMLKIGLKKFPSQNFFLHDYEGTMTQFFTKKKNLTSQSLKVCILKAVYVGPCHIRICIISSSFYQYLKWFPFPEIIRV